MKTTNILGLAGISLFSAGVAGAQMPEPTSTPQSLQILQMVTPIFPRELSNIGVRNGEAIVVIGVDAAGKLDEWLVIGYTYPEFADAAVTAIKQWKFKPARLRGEPVSCTVELSIHYKTEGVQVVSQGATDYFTNRLLTQIDKGFVYRPRTLRELDRIPTPITIVKPAYTRALADLGVKGSVRIEFYIDETGAVRLPAAASGENFNLAGLAIPALSQWKFEPPTFQGKPVLVKASQVFTFAPDKQDKR